MAMPPRTAAQNLTLLTTKLHIPPSTTNARRWRAWFSEFLDPARVRERALLRGAGRTVSGCCLTTGWNQE
jgi:hypothetical protein